MTGARFFDDRMYGECGIEVEVRFNEIPGLDRAKFAKALCDAGHHGHQLIPVDPQYCQQALARYQQYRDQLHAELVERTAQKTTDGKLQGGVVKLLEAHWLTRAPG